MEKEELKIEREAVPLMKRRGEEMDRGEEEEEEEEEEDG